jgi:hypothetical protein
MNCLPNDLYFTKLKKEYLQELLAFYIIEIYEHFDYIDYTQESYNHELETLLKEDNTFFDNSIYYILKDIERHQIHGSIRLTYWDKKAPLPIEKLFHIKAESLVIPEIANYWHIGRFVISQKLPSSRISILKQMLFNAFYPVYSLGNGLIIAECDKKVTVTLEKLGIKCVTLGKSIEYICSETLPIYIKSEWLSNFISSNSERYYSGKNIQDTNKFFQKISN